MLSSYLFLHASILVTGVIENATFFLPRSFISMGFPREIVHRNKFLLPGLEMENPDRISLVGETCKNIKSRNNPKDRCTNPASQGEYCGVHYKHPRPWTPGSPENIGRRVKRRHAMLASAPTVTKIQAWYRFWRGFKQFRRHGPGYWDRSVNTNDSDFFSTDSLADVQHVYFFSYKDVDNHCYGFDVRSMHSILYRARLTGENPFNPYTRSIVPATVQRSVSHLTKWLTKRGYTIEWAPLEPPTPEQQWRMKVVDLFTKIDELNYYSSPDWFIGLHREGHIKFYRELHAIWSHRAGLSIQQKYAIVPHFMQRLFRHAPWALGEQTLESLQKINMNVIRLIISSAEDRNDRIIGAMYVVSTLTLVCEEAKNAYPWLYESVVEEAETYADNSPHGAPLFGIQWLHNLLNISNRLPLVPPPLQLPPPRENNT